MSPRFFVTFLLAAATAAAHAGGHFDVDDAGTLDPGRCQVEVWHFRLHTEDASLWHLGPACRVGPFELGLNVERISVGDALDHLIGPQLKWTFLGQGPDARLSAALSATAGTTLPGRGRVGGQFVVPVSWRATDSLTVHANLGVDWAPVTGERSGRGGLAGAWALNGTWTLIAERNRAFGLWTSRAGVRYTVTPTFSIDASASRTGPEGVLGVVVGFNYEFGR